MPRHHSSPLRLHLVRGVCMYVYINMHTPYDELNLIMFSTTNRIKPFDLLGPLSGCRSLPPLAFWHWCCCCVDFL